MDAAGDTVTEPFVGTAPTPSMETSVVFVVRQVRDADPPRWIVLGSDQIEADWSATADSSRTDAGDEE